MATLRKAARPRRHPCRVIRAGNRVGTVAGMELTSRHLRRAVSDSTGLTEEEIGFLIAAAVVATGVVVALRTLDVVTRLWAPSGGRA